jgi:Flp pilus assembly pilin Flp
MNRANLARVVAIRGWMRRRLPREDGYGLVDYALILALLAVVVLVALRFLS